MSYTAVTAPRVVRPGDFTYRRPIIKGGDLDDAVHKSGVKDLATTQLALIQNLGHPIVCDSPNVTVAINSVTLNIVQCHRFPIPKYLNKTGGTGRRFLRLNVTGKTSTGTWGLVGTTSAGTSSAVGGGTTTTSTISVDVPLAEGPADDYILIKIYGSTSATFSYYNCAAWVLPNTSALMDGGEIYNKDKITPVDDTDETFENAPLTVPAVRNLIAANDAMWRHNVRPVINFCAVQAYGATLTGASTSGSGTEIVLSDNVGSRRKTWQWIYFPRPGVDRLRVYWDGVHTAPSTYPCALGFIGQAAETGGAPWGEFSVTSTTTYFTSTSWGGTFDIPVPAGPGPFFLELAPRTFGTVSIEARIAALSIYELGED